MKNKISPPSHIFQKRILDFFNYGLTSIIIFLNVYDLITIYKKQLSWTEYIYGQKKGQIDTLGDSYAYAHGPPHRKRNVCRDINTWFPMKIEKKIISLGLNGSFFFTGVINIPIYT